MRSNNNILRKQSLRFMLCAFALSLSAPILAQDEAGEAEEAQTVKRPKREKQVSKYPTMEIRGKVYDMGTGAPLAGVQLQMLGNTQYAAMSDEEGNFTIKVPTFTTTLFAFSPGYASQQIAINNDDPSQVVVVKMLSGKFNSMYENTITYTASKKIDTSNSNNVTIDADIENQLGGDVHAIQRSGVADGGAAMFIRGLNSLNANAQPLILVDGIEQDMQLDRSALHSGQFVNMLSNISTNDIESVQVLKNATALYGARGANGVILITTKRGHSQATRIDANIYAGITLKPSLPNVMNASQYRNYATELLGTMTEIQERKNPIEFNFLNDDPTNYYYYTYHNDVDWKDYVYRDAITQNYNVNVQGGDDVGMYNLSIGYMDAKSTAKKNGFDRMNVRFNTDIEIFKKLTTKFDISISRTNNDVFDDGAPANLSSGTITTPTFLSLIKAPIVSPYQYSTIQGKYTSLLSNYDDIYSQLGSGYSLANPVAILNNANGDNKNKAENTIFNVRLVPTLDINKSLKLTEDVSYSYNRNSQRYYRPFVGVPSFEISDLGTVTSMVMSLFSKENIFVTNTRLDWNHNYGKHTLSAFGGFRYQTFSYDSPKLSTEYTSETNDKNPTLSASSGYQEVRGANDAWKNMQWYGNFDYNYMNKYFATVSLLAEANSRFGENKGLKMFGTRWAIFPSVQAAWVLTNEKWFPKTNGVNYLRINAGFDMSGNDNISNYAARTSLSAVKYNYRATGLQLTNIGNDDIKWETTTKFNVGVQGYFVNNRIGAGVDFYIHNTKDLLALKSFDNPIGGINNYWSNGGSLRNVGAEVSISFKPIVSKDWNMEIGATVGHYKNKVTKLPDGDFTSSIYGDKNIITSVGNPVGMFFGYQTAGIFSTDAEAKQANKGDYLYMIDETGAMYNFGAGDVHFIDQNGDGIISEADKVIIGDPNPDIYGNIFANVNFKRFTLNIGFNYSLGNDVYNYQRSILNSGSNFFNQQVAEVNRWRYESQKADLPRVNYGDPLGNNRFSDRWIEDGSYLRLKTVKLNYNVPVPGSWSWLQGLNIWAEARNLFTFTHYLGSDPEFSIGNGVLYQGIDAGNIAQSRSFLVGLKINL